MKPAPLIRRPYPPGWVIRTFDEDGDGDAERLLVCVGPIPPDGTEPGCIEVMNGRGVAGNPPFGVPGIDPNEPVWNWEGNNPDAHAKWPDVLPCPVDPPDSEEWFFADLVNGKLCVTISGDWPAESNVKITVRAHNACQRLDLDGPAIRFTGAGSAADCAAKIKDFLRCAFLTQTGAIVNVTCDPIPGTNAVKITIELENGKPIDWGLCTICIVEGASTPDDADDDGLTNQRERQLATDPNNPDTDGDGLLDGQGVNDTGTDPLDSTDCATLVIDSIDLTTGRAVLRIPRTRPGVVYSFRHSADLRLHPGTRQAHPPESRW